MIDLTVVLIAIVTYCVGFVHALTFGKGRL